jgi:NTE family protein
VSVRFSRTFLRDYTVGLVKDPNITLAEAVAASSAFPPVLSPVTIDTRRSSWTREQGNVHFDDTHFTRRLVLTDGGVYDNMGLEAVWDRYETVLVSDAGAPFGVDRSPSGIWPLLAGRAFQIVNEQARALRKRWLIQEMRAGRANGAFWGIGSQIANYLLPTAIARDSSASRALSHLRTRLNAFSSEEQRRLINWGYALADTAIRRHLPTPGQEPGRQPYPEFAL